MKINFDQTVQKGVPGEPGVQERTGTRQARRQSRGVGGYGAYVDGPDSVHPGNALGSRWNRRQRASATQGKTMADIQAQAGMTDAQLMQDQMTVMSHTLSDEDYARMTEEGYDPREMDPQETVTILDKIKAELVKGGCHIAGYTDTLDMDTLAAAVGDAGLAQALRDSFAAADIPLSRENVEKVIQALDLAEQLETPDDGDCYYMVSSGMEATVKGYYLAQASGCAVEQERQAEYFESDIRGYVTRNIADQPEEQGNARNLEEDDEEVDPRELDRLLSSLGCEGSEQEREAAKWMIQRGLPIDRDSLRRTVEIRGVSFPVEKEHVALAAAAAIADGRESIEGNLADTRTVRQKAYDLMTYYQSSDAERRISDHRLLEEIRLRMTVETNIKLLESGFSIDTRPIEETIEALKQAQQELARAYFPEPELTDRQALERYTELKEAWQVAAELPDLPIDTVGLWQERLQDPESQEQDLAGFHQSGKALQAQYEKAGQRYETLWTAPRADMGDSIQKAFSNVDDILRDMGYEPTEENRRAVRVLGYNRMEITPQHVEEIRAACATVEEVVTRMTPAAVLRMIRDGVNPLEQSLPQLQEYFENQEQDSRQEAERYSRFLYKLEKKGEITPEEKSAFIGCYRLLRQIEKGDSAAIGNVINTGAEMNFSTLLSSVRSRRAGRTNTLVDDAVGSLERLREQGVRIDEQINMGYAKEWSRVLEEAAEPDAQETLAGQEEESARMRRELAQAAQSAPEACETVERAAQTPAAANILAAQDMEEQIRRILERWNAGSRNSVKPAQLWRRLQEPEEFQQQYREAVASQEEQNYQKLLEDADSLVDVRSLQLMTKQLHLMGGLAQSEEYYFPMELDGELAAIHLQICRGEQEKGLVRVELTGGSMGDLSGEFQVRDGVVNGYFVGNERRAVMNLRGMTDIFDSYLAGDMRLGQVEYVYSESGKTVMSWDRTQPEETTPQGDLYRVAKAFLQTVREMGKQTEGNPF